MCNGIIHVLFFTGIKILAVRALKVLINNAPKTPVTGIFPSCLSHLCLFK